MRYAFASYTFDEASLALQCHGVPLPLRPKTASVLGYLLANAGQLVSKADLMDALWSDEDVTEANLTQHVFLLRRLFAAHSPGESFLLTHAGKGYRFVVPVEPMAGEPPRRAGWREYARGRFYADQRTQASLDLALQEFARAHAADADSIDVLAGIAAVRVLRAEYLFAPPEELEQGREAAEAVLASDPEHSEALMALGDVRLFRDWDVAAARLCYERVMLRDPAAARPRVLLAWAFAIAGAYDEAVHEIETALAREPYSLELQTMLGVVALMRGAYDEAEACCDDVLALDPTHRRAAYYRRAALAYGDRPALAVSAYLDAQEQAGHEYAQQSMAIAGYAAARAGDRAMAEGILEAIRGGARFPYVSPVNVAHVLAGLGRVDDALAEIARAVRERDAWTIFVPQHPVLRDLPGVAAVTAAVRKPRA